MKVLITAPSLDETENISGISSVVRQIIARADAEFFHFAAGRKDGAISGPNWLFDQTVLIPSFMRRLKKTKPDIVHINTAMTRLSVIRDLVLTRTAKRAGFPVLLHIHGGRFFTEGFGGSIFQRMTRRMLGSAKSVAVLSETERSFVKALAGPELDIRVLENAVPLDQVARRAGGQNRVRTITFLGRLHAGKGLSEIIEACRVLKGDGFKFRFSCYGTGPDKDSFNRKMRELLGENFHFGGVISGVAKWQALAECDIFLLPSHYEGLPMSLLEAMAAGCVPVVSDVGSVGDVVTDGENGFLTVPRDVPSIVAKLRPLLGSETGLSRYSEAARETIVNRFDLAAYIEKLERLYDEILGR